MSLPRYHFSGIAGAGMNPLARLMRARGHDVQGSDRSLDQGKNARIAAELASLGIRVIPQDGTGVTAGIDRFIYSTAVEADTPEMRAARALGLDMVPRPALLAEIVNAGQPGVAIAGTSGKSTITGMVGFALREAGRASTVIGGAALVGEGSGGCFIPGPADGPVAAEACESDGTLVGYRPAIGLIHNVSRDHAELPSLRAQFSTFAERSARLLVNARCPEALAIGRRFKAVTYGAVAFADVPLDVAAAGPDRARGVLRLPGGDLALDIPQPGLHNLENAAAAAMVALEVGVARSLQVIGPTSSGVRVVDDYAHNADKLRAAIVTAQAGAGRVVAVFQPHGFGPARFLRSELRDMLPTVLRPNDRFCYAEIFYAGGTVAKDIGSRMLADDLPPALRCGYAADHDAVRRWVAGAARPGDTVLIMGARDPDLPVLARTVFDTLQG
ncbi:MAG: hypothetical protein HYU41_07510 [Candidatus Rokubacteria bacterium]|nr:hypothetical protein [Candidatus Rokubacteria bacterium]